MAGETPTPPPQAPAGTPAQVLAFFTTNDTRPSTLPRGTPLPARLDNTQRFKARADTLASAGRVHGATGITAATAVVNALPANLRLSKVFLVGHGFDDGFFFGGKPDPKLDFTSSSLDEVFRGPGVTTPQGPPSPADTAFVDALAKHFGPTDFFEIGILACFSGKNRMVRSICDHLKSKGFKNFVVGGYRNDYQTRYIFSTPAGAILEWTDEIIDSRDEKTVLEKKRKGELPKYENKCLGPNTPTDPLDF